MTMLHTTYHALPNSWQQGAFECGTAMVGDGCDAEVTQPLQSRPDVHNRQPVLQPLPGSARPQHTKTAVSRHGVSNVATHVVRAQNKQRYVALGEGQEKRGHHAGLLLLHQPVHL